MRKTVVWLRIIEKEGRANRKKNKIKCTLTTRKQMKLPCTNEVELIRGQNLTTGRHK